MQETREAAMKALQWLATVMFVAAGIVLLCAPANGQGSPSAAKAAFLKGAWDGGTEVPPLQSTNPPLQSTNAPLQSGQAVVAASSSAKFVPTRFTVTDAGTAGKPDVVLIPGLASSVASDRAVVAEALYEDLMTDMRPGVGKIKTPTLVLYEYDASSKMPDASAYEGLVKDGYKGMPNVTLVRVEDSKHFIMYDQPGRLDKELEGWLR